MFQSWSFGKEEMSTVRRRPAGKSKERQEKPRWGVTIIAILESESKESVKEQRKRRADEPRSVRMM
jgi:hypothetical protein